MNRLKIDKVNLRQVQNHAGGLLLNLSAELFDAVGSDSAD
jgi:hypothetical protein